MLIKKLIKNVKPAQVLFKKCEKKSPTQIQTKTKDRDVNNRREVEFGCFLFKIKITPKLFGLDVNESS